MGDEMAVARLGIVELASQARGAAAAEAVAHHHDLLHLELGHGEFQRRGNAVITWRRLKGRGEICDVAHDEHLAGPGVEDDAPDRPGCRSRR